jgi:hypothetical protein
VADEFDEELISNYTKLITKSDYLGIFLASKEYEKDAEDF